jgi:hypothetical protein
LLLSSTAGSWLIIIIIMLPNQAIASTPSAGSWLTLLIGEAV